MLILILVSFLLAMCAVGWGYGFWSALRRLSSKPLAELPLGVLGFMGLFSIGTLATAYNFFAPVGTEFSAFVLVVGVLFGLHLWTHSISAHWRECVSVMCAFAAAFAIVAVATRPGYDAGLYHLPHQLWLRSDKIVIGLANLHGRFGFNSILEPLLATAWLPSSDLAIAQIVPSLFKTFFFSALYDEVRFRSRNEFSKAYLALMLIVGYLLASTFLRIASDDWAANDTPSGLALLLGYYYCIMALEDGDPADFSAGLFLVAFASAIKLSSIFALPLLLIVVFWVVRREGLRRIPIVASIALLACFLPWLLRGVLISGCLAYPAASSCLDWLPWNATAAAANDTSWVKAWARAPRTDLVHADGWAWLPGWLKSKRRFLLTAALIAVVMTAIATVLARGETTSRWSRAIVVAVMTCGILPVATWFLLAPDPRFAFGHIVFLLVVPGFCILALREPKQFHSIKRAAALVMLTSPWILAGQQTIRNGNFYMSYPPFGYRPLLLPLTSVLPDPVFGTRPATGDQCWLAAPGCAPNARNIDVVRSLGFQMLKAKQKPAADRGS